jgi:hypothetical protein
MGKFTRIYGMIHLCVLEGKYIDMFFRLDTCTNMYSTMFEVDLFDDLQRPYKFCQVTMKRPWNHRSHYDIGPRVYPVLRVPNHERADLQRSH